MTNADDSNKPIVSIIVAMARNRVIGRDGDLPWRLPDDLKHFKSTTKGRPLIMGRRTWESIGSRPLPGRPAIVVTRQRDYEAPGGRVEYRVDEAIDSAMRIDHEEVFVCGGEAIYRAALESDAVDRIYLTQIDAHVEGDTRFPEFDTTIFREVSRVDHPADAAHAHPYSFVVYER